LDNLLGEVVDKDINFVSGGMLDSELDNGHKTGGMLNAIDCSQDYLDDLEVIG